MSQDSEIEGRSGMFSKVELTFLGPSFVISTLIISADFRESH